MFSTGFTQQEPSFNVYYTDVSDFPTVRMHYTAHNRFGFKISEDN